MPRLIVLASLLLIPVVQAKASVIRDLRIGNSDDHVRVVLEFDRPLTTYPSLSVDQNRLSVTISGITNTLNPLPAKDKQIGLLGLNMSDASGTIHIDTIYEFMPADIKTFALTGPHRFIIDAYRPLPSQTASQPIENEFPARSPEAHDHTPEPYSTFEKPTSAALSTTIVEASLNAYDKLASSRPGETDMQPNRLQQHLIAALIVVTSIIVVMLFFLIWIGGGKQRSKDCAWLTDLPPTNDQAIASIDATIRDHLKTYDQT